MNLNFEDFQVGRDLSNILIRERFLIYIYREFYATFIMIYWVANAGQTGVYDPLTLFILLFYYILRILVGVRRGEKPHL
jgi:hypothetical protein